jgi:hypothetical protein
VLHRARRHAVAVAARVAVVLGVFQLGRQRTGGALSLAATRLATVAAVPLIIVAVQSSSPSTPHPNPPPQGGREMTAPLLQGGREMPLLQGGREMSAPVLQAGKEMTQPPLNVGKEISGTPDSLVPGSTATLRSAIDVVHQLLGPLPSVPAPPTLTLP